MGNGTAVSTRGRRICIILAILMFLIGWIVAALIYTGSAAPTLRRVRLFHPSKDRIKMLKVQAETALGLKTVATFTSVDAEFVAASDAGHQGFEIAPGVYAENVNKLVISITMDDLESGTSVDLPDITLNAPSGTFGGVTIIVDDHATAKHWRVLATGFYADEDLEPLQSHEVLPRITEESPP